MQNKLQELTDKLYNEGLSKGKAEAEKMVSDAKKEASDIIAKANSDAQKIIADAQAQAKAASEKAIADTLAACRQSIASTKQEIENVVTLAVADAPVKAALSDSEFICDILKTAISSFAAGSEDGLEVTLPESLKSNLEAYLSKGIASKLGAGVSVTFSGKISGGFTVAPKGKGYFVSFTDEAFSELVSEYMRPATKKILFG